MRLRLSLIAAFAAVAIPLAAQETTAQGTTEITPPPTSGCWLISTPTQIKSCDGAIIWGAAHGVARVRSTVSVDAPRISPGMSVTYAWKVGSTYASARRYYTLSWSSVGKIVSVKVLVATRHGAFAKVYNFGVVKPPA